MKKCLNTKNGEKSDNLLSAWLLINFDLIVDDNNNANDEELRRYSDPWLEFQVSDRIITT